ncbi:YncE family protein [Agromyces cerinus subsp. nitratus]|uniref:YncE family protein n=1 Tax=Agromyces cerinus TaxID=33878 RepID=UPI00362CB295
MPLGFSVQRVDLPRRADPHPAYPSHLRRLPDATLVTTWIEGTAAVRLAVIDPRSGAVTVRKGIRGQLRDVVVSEAGDRAWLFCTNGVHEFDVATSTVRRTLTKGLGVEASRPLRLDEDTVLLVQRFAATSAIVSLERMEVIGRLRFDRPDFVHRRGDHRMLLSFADGRGRTLGADNRLVRGGGIGVPIGITAIDLGDRIAVVSGTRHAWQNPHGLDPERFARVEPEGVVAMLDPTTFAVTRRGANLGMRRLIGPDDAGRLVGTDFEFQERGRRLIISDRDGDRLIGELVFDEPVLEGIALDGTSVAINHDAGVGSALPYISIANWSEK